MAKQRLFPEPPNQDDDKKPRERFDELATKVFTVSKSEIDEREKKWRTHRVSRKGARQQRP